jgi:hypothetical protein
VVGEQQQPVGALDATAALAVLARDRKRRLHA